MAVGSPSDQCIANRDAQLNLRTVLELCAAARCSAAKRLIAPLRRPFAPFAWPLLVQAGGLAKLEGGRLQLTAKGRTALGKPPAEVIRQLWQRWLTHGLIDESSRIEEIEGQRARNVLTAAETRRRTVAAALRSCPTDEWISVQANTPAATAATPTCETLAAAPDDPLT